MGTTPDTIKRLVDRFHQQADRIRSADYNETLIRIDFINPLMKSLGWDIDNSAGYAEQYREVVHEDRVKVAGQTKAPDYSFRVGGQRKFFLEAKKPAVDIKNNWEPAYQLRRYAWSAKLAVSLLTDFEEFAIYDTRIQPKQLEKASTGRRDFLRYTEYEDRWDFLYGTFSKDAVLRGEFDRYSGSKKGRGAAPVDDVFLSEIEEWRKALAISLARRNDGLDEASLNFAVQRIIDRILFLRIAEDRGTETVGQLQSLLNGEGVYRRIVTLFNRADERYNSGLFHFAKEKDRDETPDELTPTLEVEDRTLKIIINGLYYPQSPYEFTMLPAEILGSVYERFLGKVISLTGGHTARIVEKPEVRKAGGVYYTPIYIVHYIVQNTVGKLLDGKTPKEAAKIKILDPACGSGSFLIGAYQFLLDWYLMQYASCDPASLVQQKNAPIRPAIVKSAESPLEGPIIPGWALTIAERKRILLTHLHGVDLDAQAVEVTKLNLLLKCLEGETSQTLGFDGRLFRERALPDLGKNILCGNSLIGTDIIGTPAWKRMTQEERDRMKPFDYEHAFQQVFGNGKSEGFNAIIGNPPYGYMLTETEQAYFRDTYSHQDYQLDNYQLFVERCLSKYLNSHGLWGMIIPNPWLTNITQKSLRRYVIRDSSLKQVVHFEFPVFPKVTVDTEVVLLEKPHRRETVTEALFVGDPKELQDGSFRRIQHAQAKWLADDGAVINLSVDERSQELVRAIRQRAPRVVEDVVALNVGIKPYQKGKGTPPQSAGVVAERPFDADTKLDETYRVLLRGRDVNRYRIEPTEQRFLSYGPWLAEPRPAANFDAAEKIYMRQTGDSLIAAIDFKRRIGMNNLHVIVPTNDEWSARKLLPILNSRLLNWFYQTINPEKGEALAEVKRSHIAQLPLPKVEPLRATRLVSLVDTMLALHERLSAEQLPQRREQIQREIEATDRQIDALVYKLYGLTDEEIAIVEEATR